MICLTLRDENQSKLVREQTAVIDIFMSSKRKKVDLGRSRKGKNRQRLENRNNRMDNGYQEMGNAAETGRMQDGAMKLKNAPTEGGIHYPRTG